MHSLFYHIQPVGHEFKHLLSYAELTCGLDKVFASPPSHPQTLSKICLRRAILCVASYSCRYLGQLVPQARDASVTCQFVITWKVIFFRTKNFLSF